MNKVFDTSVSLAAYIGERWKQLQNDAVGEFLVCAPLSSTPLPVYDWVAKHASMFTHWDQFRFVLMDEQVIKSGKDVCYVDVADPASYERFCKEKTLNPLHKYISSSVLLKPELNHFGKFDTMLQRHGGIDLLILAIGARGHYAQVMPGTSEEEGFHVATLIPEFITAHTKGDGAYKGTKFQQCGMSLGPLQVLGAKNVIVMITGERKRELARELLSYNRFDLQFPLSIIYHPKMKGNVEVLLSKDAASPNQ